MECHAHDDGLESDEVPSQALDKNSPDFDSGKSRSSELIDGSLCKGQGEAEASECSYLEREVFGSASGVWVGDSFIVLSDDYVRRPLYPLLPLTPERRRRPRRGLHTKL